MRILGIDPGYGIVGYSVIEYVGNKFNLITAGAITTKANSEFNTRLEDIYKAMNEIIDTFKPEEMAIEDLFFNQNTKTAIKVAEARGVILLSSKQKGLGIYEYTPLQVKQGVVGYGRATKVQVKQMVQSILNTDKVPKLDDITDAIAIAICHAHSRNATNLLNKYMK